MIIMNFVNGKNNKMNLEQFVIHKSATIVEALKKIELNHNGFVLIHDFEKKIIGIATDGDIRRRLLNNPNLEDSILECANVDFIKAQNDTPREKLLKQLDSKIKAIPILNEKNELESIVTRDFIPERVQQKVYARSKSPVRISFGGGGSDISAYFSENKAAVINATISLYSHATLKIRDDDKIILNSLDLNDKIEFKNIIELQKYDGRFSLIKSVIKAINPSFGFELFVHSDFPMSSGLGGSAVVTSSILDASINLEVISGINMIFLRLHFKQKDYILEFPEAGKTSMQQFLED